MEMRHLGKGHAVDRCGGPSACDDCAREWGFADAAAYAQETGALPRQPVQQRLPRQSCCERMDIARMEGAILFDGGPVIRALPRLDGGGEEMRFRVAYCPFCGARLEVMCRE
jgi:hypothetical protein